MLSAWMQPAEAKGIVALRLRHTRSRLFSCTTVTVVFLHHSKAKSTKATRDLHFSRCASLKLAVPKC